MSLSIHEPCPVLLLHLLLPISVSASFALVLNIYVNICVNLEAVIGL